jgi:hypothetical protein
MQLVSQFSLLLRDKINAMPLHERCYTRQRLATIAATLRQSCEMIFWYVTLGNFSCNLTCNKIARQVARNIAQCNSAFIITFSPTKFFRGKLFYGSEPPPGFSCSTVAQIRFLHSRKKVIVINFGVIFNIGFLSYDRSF